ncbi:unnamed protein product [Mycena citricolor]|uniref:Uncharacterized protein n=1 Tax=Mycena citricolor TaxID=2018698 RepID=A0AAD2HRI2_9AGAR|nr:unnamed protein product [Mycena citricolor]
METTRSCGMGLGMDCIVLCLAGAAAGGGGLRRPTSRFALNEMCEILDRREGVDAVDKTGASRGRGRGLRVRSPSANGWAGITGVGNGTGAISGACLLCDEKDARNLDMTPRSELSSFRLCRRKSKTRAIRRITASATTIPVTIATLWFGDLAIFEPTLAGVDGVAVAEGSDKDALGVPESDARLSGRDGGMLQSVRMMSVPHKRASDGALTFHRRSNQVP